MLLVYIAAAGATNMYSEGTVPAYPTFETHKALSTYIEQRGIRYLDLGASKGGSRNLMEMLVHEAKPAAATHGNAVLGLDISDEKLRMCNAQGKVLCAKADLIRLFARHNAQPVVNGVSMIDILEHINFPAVDAAHVPPHRLRFAHGSSFDTASHSTAVRLWRASCAAAKHFCFMNGPSYDGEASLRALGFMRYYEAWSGHTCHLNSTSLVAAMTRSPGEGRIRPGTSLVMLMTRIPSSSSNEILRQPPALVDRSCNAKNKTRFELGCDRGPNSQEPMRHSITPSTSKQMPPLLYPKNGPTVDLRALDIFRSMIGLRTFHDEIDGLSRAAAMLIKRYAAKKDTKIVHCSLSSQHQLSEAECVKVLINAANQRLA